MDDDPKSRIVPAKVHVDTGVTAVSADSVVENDRDGFIRPADHPDKEVEETLAGGLKFPEGA